MADSEAVRSRRKRLHALGDHSSCRRCAAVTGRPAPGMTLLPPSAPAVKFDAVAELRELAAELHAAYRQDPANAMLARECRSTLALLMPKDAGKADADLTGLLKALG